VAAIIAGVLALIAALLKLLMSRKGKNEKEKSNDQTFENALASGDSDTLSSMFADHTAPPGYKGHSSRQNHQKATQRKLRSDGGVALGKIQIRRIHKRRVRNMSARKK